jgi:phosphatidylserine decarboxylase
LKSKRETSKKKDSNVSGEVLLQFSLYDAANPSAAASEIYRKFRSVVCAGEQDEFSQIPTNELEDMGKEEETSYETDDPIARYANKSAVLVVLIFSSILSRSPSASY